MSMWQFFAAIEGVRKANDPKAGQSLSDAEADELWQWIN